MIRVIFFDDQKSNEVFYTLTMPENIVLSPINFA
jgi:hypothetical protein